MDVIEIEGERRRRYIADLRTSNIARCDEICRDLEERVFTYPVEHRNDRARRELAERDARWRQEREQDARSEGQQHQGALVTVDYLEARLKAERRAVAQVLGEELGRMLQQ